MRRVSGQSLAALAQARIFGPLGMTSTHVHDDPTVIVPKLATGYTRGDHGLRLGRAPGGIVGNAGLFTTAGDLLTWEENFGHPVVGTPEIIAAMQTPAVLSTAAASPYGLGLFVERYRGLAVTSHGGSDPGASAYVMRFPDRGLAVAVLCNEDSIDAVGLAHGVAEHYLGPSLEPRPPVPAAGPQAVAPTPAQLEAYAGLYREPATEGLLRLYVKDGVLMGSPGAGADGGWAVTPIDARRFSIPTTPIVLEFVRRRPARRCGCGSPVSGRHPTCSIASSRSPRRRPRWRPVPAPTSAPSSTPATRSRRRVTACRSPSPAAPPST